MNNQYAYTEEQCGRCGASNYKQIPEQWDDDNHIFFYPDWYFCLECGYHFMIEEKKVA